MAYEILDHTGEALVEDESLLQKSAVFLICKKITKQKTHGIDIIVIAEILAQDVIDLFTLVLEDVRFYHERNVFFSRL